MICPNCGGSVAFESTSNSLKPLCRTCNKVMVTFNQLANMTISKIGVEQKTIAKRKRSLRVIVPKVS